MSLTVFTSQLLAKWIISNNRIISKFCFPSHFSLIFLDINFNDNYAKLKGLEKDRDGKSD